MKDYQKEYRKLRRKGHCKEVARRVAEWFYEDKDLPF